MFWLSFSLSTSLFEAMFLLPSFFGPLTQSPDIYITSDRFGIAWAINLNTFCFTLQSNHVTTRIRDTDQRKQMFKIIERWNWISFSVMHSSAMTTYTKHYIKSCRNEEKRYRKWVSSFQNKKNRNRKGLLKKK
jgi:hypothetical protein